MHPYSKLTASPNQAIRAPAIQSNNVIPTLPTDRKIAPGVAKIPLNITQDMVKMYALLHPRLRPSTAVSGRTSFSTDRSRGLQFLSDASSSFPDFHMLL
jgi:hypothetical protein